ncbi:CRISPR-associated protein Cas5 [Acidovorax sp.]
MKAFRDAFPLPSPSAARGGLCACPPPCRA